MSSRFPPPGRGDSRYIPRDRSPPRYPDRRPTGPHVGAPPSARGHNDFFHRANDMYAHPGPRRDPPRGPKAFGGGPTRGYAPRGRGFRGRGDGLAREHRELRDPSVVRREQDQRDWGWRDRDPSRERRPSPVGRNRSRSPVPREFRDNRDFAPRDIEHERSRRNSREGFVQPSPATSDQPLSAGLGNRGSYFGRGRLEREFSGRGRGSFGEEREPFRARSRSRERPWERRSFDDRDRDWFQGASRRDDSFRKEWTEGDRDSVKATRDQYSNRPESGINVNSRSASTSPRPAERHSSGRPSYEGRQFDNDLNGRHTTTYTHPGDPQVSERSNAVSVHQGRDLPPQRASSPPQAPQVPAFGSVVFQQPAPDSSAEAYAHKKDPPLLTPSSQSAPTMTNIPSAPKAQLLSGMPTGPRADPYSGRRPISDTINTPPRWPEGRTPKSAGSPHTSTSEVSSGITLSGEPDNVLSKGSRFAQPPQQTASSRSPTFISSSKAPVEMGRYTNNVLPSSTGQAIRPPPQDQPSLLKIPTGPRAERSTSTAKQAIPSPSRVPFGRPTMLQRSRPTNLRWVRPGFPTHPPRGPSIMSPMAIKNDYAEEDGAGSLDGDIEEREITPATPPAMTAKSPSPELMEQRWAGADAQKPAAIEQQDYTNLNNRQEPIEPPKQDHINAGDDDTVMEDEQMDLDQEYLADERKFQNQIRLIESRRPASPRRNIRLLALLDEIDALASAADDRANGVATRILKPEHANEPNLNAYPSPKLVQDDPFQEGMIISPYQDITVSTPPIDSLPYLMSGPPTPFSEVEDLQNGSDLQEILDAQLMNELTTRLRLESDDHEEIKEQYYQDYRAWRLAVEDYEDKKAASSSVPATPAPVQTPLIPSIPMTEGRRSARNVSELDFERALRDSVVLASEEQQRREQEAKSSINPEKEAVIPDMLKDYDIKTQNLVDTTNLIPSSDAYSVFGYIPAPDNFTAEEHDVFTETFLANPKKFGEIAKSLPNRTYQDCINHYYLTKHEQQYKEKLAHRLKKGRRGPARSTGRPRGSAPSLLSNAMVDERNQIEVTDTGRPRRAAAPTFGDTIDPEASVLAVTPARRNASGTKGDGSEMNPEKPPNRRGRGGANKERVPRKTKTHLLAAAPGPSPQKIDKESTRGKSKELKIENDQQLDDIKAGELLANLHHNQNTPSFSQQPSSESWTASQSLPVNTMSQVPKPQFPMQEQLQPQQRAGSTSSYWSVPEQTDFNNLLHHFGTNWQAIADHMKTKTQTMVKNYYHRQVERGDGKFLEEAAQTANEKIKRGEDMGQPPPPTIVAKRRYDTGPQIVPPRPLAPSLDGTELSREPSNFQTSKPSKMSPPEFNAGHQKISSLIQAEPVPSKLLPDNHPHVSAAPPSQATNQSGPQRAPQTLQGPRVGFFTDERTRPTLQPQPTAPLQLQQLQQQEPQLDSRPQKPLLEQPRIQNLQEIPQVQDPAKRHDHPSPPNRYQAPTQVQQPRIPHQGNVPTRPIKPPAPQRIAASQNTDLNIRPRVTTTQQLLLQQSSLNDQRQEGQRMDNAAVIRHLDTFGPRQPTMPSPVKPRLSMTFSPPQEVARPSSVPSAPPAAPAPQAPQAPKRSNIMSILNDEPAEPQARKRVSDARPTAPTPPPQSPASQLYPPPVQQFARRETHTSEPQHPLQQYHQRASLAQVLSQHQSPQAREGPSNWATVAQRTSLERQSNFQQPRAESPRLQPSYSQQGQRASLQSLPRTHAPTPPPFGHSRTSSYASLQSQQPQAQHQSQQSSQATPVLQPSPYTQMHPQQTMQSHNQHQHSQPQPQHQHQHSQQTQHQPQHAPAQPLQPHHRPNGPGSYHAAQYMRQQEAIQQQENSMQRQSEASRPDMLQFQGSQGLELARRQASEQARRDEMRRIFTPPVSGRHPVYGPPPDRHARGYEERR